MKRLTTIAKVVAGILLIVVLAGGAIFALYSQSCLSRAQRYSRHGLWRHVQSELRYYLWLHPASPQAHFLMAEALVKDESRPGTETVDLAVEHLRRIPHDSALAAQSKIQEGRLRLFRLDQPSRAEDAFMETLRLEPDNVEANYLLWKLYELTGRSFLVEPFFWKVYEKSAAEDRPLRLRDWYLSQYFPLTANPSLNVVLGVIKPDEKPTQRTEADRLIRFRRAEPDRPVAHVAMARWFQSEGDPKFALELLEQAAAASQGHPDPFLVATMISVQMDLGDFDSAKEWWQKWPEPRDGYEYWLWTGVVHEQVDADYAQAAQAYRQAIKIWPGVIDWRTRHRLVNCLQRSGDLEGVKKEREAARHIESMSAVDLHDRLLAMSQTPTDPKVVGSFVDFYTQIGRDREANCWRDQKDNIGTQTPPNNSINSVPP